MSECDYCQHVEMCRWQEDVERQGCDFFDDGNKWIPVSERLPKTDNKNSINNYNVLLWVKDKNNPENEPQIYLGKLKKVNGDDGSHNFWGIKTKPCDWTIWGWSYFHEPEVIAWMPLPEPYKAESEVSE